MKLIEKHAAEVGLPGLKVTWTRFSDGPGMNEALLSGNLDIANGGLTALIVLFDKSRGAYTGLAPLSSMPAVLMMRRPAAKGVADLKSDDRIALVSRVSMQAIILRMFAQKALGNDRTTELDALTVPLPHSEAMATVIAGKSEITGHFTAAPFYQIEEAAGLNRVLNSYDVLGGPATYSVTWHRVRSWPRTRRLRTPCWRRLRTRRASVTTIPGGLRRLTSSRKAPHLTQH